MTHIRLRYLLQPVERVGHDDKHVLSVYREHGVIPKDSRRDNFNKTPENLSRYQLVTPGDLVVNKMKAWSGSVGVSEHLGIVSPDYLVCSVSPLVHPKFLHHALRSAVMIHEMRKRSKGIRPSQERLYWDDLAEIRLLVPALERQRRIADFLDDQVGLLDRATDLRQQQIGLLSERHRAFVRETVASAGLPVRVAPEGVPWVGQLAQEGEVRNLGRILTLQRGVDLTADERMPGDVPVVTTGGIVGTHDRSIVPDSGVVIGRYGTVGSVFWVDGPHWPHNTTLYVKDYKDNSRKYCYFLLQAYPYDRLQARAAVPGVNRNDMQRDLMPWLPRTLQDRAVVLLEESVNHKQGMLDVLNQSLVLLTERKQALITAAVVGEFDVTTARSVA